VAPDTQATQLRPNLEGDGFTLVSHSRRSRKGKEKAGVNGQTNVSPAFTNITPASYAGTAAAAANIQQPKANTRRTATPVTVTEVTVIRSGGHADLQIEGLIRSRLADAIVREVRLRMTDKVAKPILLRAGRWSVHPRSKGNFVYSFDGNVPFDTILSYEHILLQPFHGTGQLRPSLGWTRLLAHGVPIKDNDGLVFGPGALLDEIRALPGLDRVFFAMPPRWLKPIDRVQGHYSTVTFAISDPDGTVSNTLMRSRVALFGKEVLLKRWIDKPALVQCSRCHALGHSKVSKACPLGKDSVKCHICGGAHKSEEHDKHCTQKHAVAGICDCAVKCLNCLKTGHNCRDHRCPARELFRPKAPRRTGKAKSSGSATNPQGQTETQLPEEDPFRPPLPLPPNASRAEKAAHKEHAFNYFMNNLYHEPESEARDPREDWMDDDDTPDLLGDPWNNFYVPGDTRSHPEASGSHPAEPSNQPKESISHSPSRLQNGADTATLA
jgi:hypothetical protein